MADLIFESQDFHFHPLALDELLEVGFGVLAEGLAREFVPLRGLWSIYPEYSNAELGLVGRDDGEGIAIGHALDHAFLNALGGLAYRGGSG
jgi:hypothetical protein